MKKSLIMAMLSGIAIVSQSFTTAPERVVETPAHPDAPVERSAAMVRAPRKAQASEGVAFTVDMAQALQDAWSEDFDAVPSGWTIDPTQHAVWKIKRIAEPGSDKSFSNIDPNDASSLYVEGDYRVYNREITNATSPLINVPAQGSLHAWVGYTLNYDDMCRLVISISDDGFETQTDVWNSKDGEGDRPWAWRPVAVDLAPWAGKQVQVRFTYTYGSADETFKTGGYMGDFAIDGLRICAPAPVSHIDVNAGDKVRFINLSTAQGALAWEFPGGDPEQSAEASPVVTYTKGGTYSVTLSVDGASTTIDNFVTVTGAAPVARILPPASFKNYDSARSYLVAPLVPVTFADVSEGYPTSRSWVFMGTTEDEPDAVETSDEEKPQVSYAFLHDHPAALEVENEHGKSADFVSVTAEYSALITNLSADAYASNFDMEDWGLFPGNLSKKAGITAFAEHFSAPSRPMRIGGCYVFFTKATAEELYDQIADIGVHLYTAENGKPGKKLDSMWWTTVDLDISATDGVVVGTDFPFTDAPFVDGEFFIVIDGFHEYSDTHCVAFAMAPLTDHGGTAWILHNGEWQPVTDYFAAGQNHTSFFVAPYVSHSVIASLPVGDDTIEVGAAGGEATHPYFTYLALESITSADEWIKITSPLPEYTVDTLIINCQPLPAGVTERVGHISITDGGSTLTLEVVQNATNGIEAVEAKSALAAECDGAVLTLTCPEGTETITIVDLAGRIVANIHPQGTVATLDVSSWPSSTYIAFTRGASAKFAK